MTDFEILKIVRDLKLESIEFNYEPYSCINDDMFVHCRLIRHYIGSNPIQALGSTTQTALSRATELFKKVIELEKIVKIPIPTSKDQKYDKGYYLKLVDKETEVEWKREGKTFYITNIRRKDEDGFYYIDKPFPVDKTYTFQRHNADGTKLYEWNNIGALCGSAGESIVDDNGMVIKTKMTRIS